MTRPAAAFCPGHISGYFRRENGKDAATTGSTGAGIVISRGVLARARPADRTTIGVFFTDASGQREQVADESLLLRSALERAGVTAAVTTECDLPIGAGFGLSAAALLATLTAVNSLYGRGMDERQIALIAHETEILHRTGLGDVVSCRGGGMVVRTVAGIDAPVHRYLNLDEPVCAISFGPIHTPRVLGSTVQMGKVAAAYPPGEPYTVEAFFARCRSFAEKSGLITPEVREVLDACDRREVLAGMTMLGNGVFAYGRGAKAALARFGPVYVMGVAKGGPDLVAERA